MILNDLPNNLLFEIFTYLDQDSFLIASTVCLKWNQIIQENLDFFTSFFAEDEDFEPLIHEEEVKYSGPDGEYTEEQKMLVNQILSLGSHEFHDILGVSENAEEDEVRNQFKKLALILHPDKNKAPESQKAFQALKKAFDTFMSGVDPDSKDTSKIDCPTSSCGATVYIANDKFTQILKGTDIGICRACKSKFGRIFCLHCFASTTISLKPELEGQLTSCSSCNKQFVIQFPKIQRRPQQLVQKEKNVVKKRKATNWWEKPK